MRGLEFVGLELLAVFPVHDPLAGGLQMFASGNRSRTAHDGHQVLAALDQHLEDRKPIFGIMVGDTFNEAGQGFGHGRGREPARVDSTIILSSVRLRW